MTFALRLPISVAERKRLDEQVERSMPTTTTEEDENTGNVEEMFIEWWLNDALRLRGFTKQIEFTYPHILEDHVEFEVASKEDAALIRLFLGAEIAGSNR